MIIELRATRYDRSADGVVWCDEDAAEQFSVYISEPGNTFSWLADFRLYEHAGDWATYYAKSRGYKLHNHVAAERESKAEEPVAT